MIGAVKTKVYLFQFCKCKLVCVDVFFMYF